MENINICSLINNISNEKNEEIKEKMKNELILRIFEKGREIDFLTNCLLEIREFIENIKFEENLNKKLSLLGVYLNNALKNKKTLDKVSVTFNLNLSEKSNYILGLLESENNIENRKKILSNIISSSAWDGFHACEEIDIILDDIFNYESSNYEDKDLSAKAEKMFSDFEYKYGVEN